MAEWMRTSVRILNLGSNVAARRRIVDDRLLEAFPLGRAGPRALVGLKAASGGT